MFKPIQFSSLCVFAVAAMVCAVLGWQQLWSWSLVVALAGALLLVAEILARSLPKAIKTQVEANCIRHDGSWAEGRAKIESLAKAKLKRNVYWLFFLVVFPNLFLLWVIDREVVPLSVGVSAISSMGVSGPTKDSLQNEELRFDKWSESKTVPANKELHKRFLWRGGPLMMLGGIVWVIACFGFIQVGYLRLLKDFMASCRLRGDSYEMRDLTRMHSARENAPVNCG